MTDTSTMSQFCRSVARAAIQRKSGECGMGELKPRTQYDTKILGFNGGRIAEVLGKGGQEGS